jgi:hypothetical protein
MSQRTNESINKTKNEANETTDMNEMNARNGMKDGWMNE